MEKRKPKVLITEQLPKEILAYINERCECIIPTNEGKMSRADVLEKISDVDGLLTSKVEVNEELLSRAHRLKIVSDISVGYDNYDVEAIKSHHVLATHTPYVLDETVADLVFSLVLSVARRIPELDRFVKDGNWTSAINESLFGKDVHSTTMGIVGMGRIGEKIARRAKLGFNMDVLYYKRKPSEELESMLGINYATLSELLERSDFVVVMTPLTSETHHLIGENEFNRMKSDAFFINASRGAVIDENALIQALKNKKIAGAGLDVFDQEPVSPDNELLKMDNVVTLPHIGSATKKTRFDMAMVGAENLVAGVTGKTPSYLIKELS
ncbi:D-glycerate dehydrogenase [Aquibacillus sp. 3ASR75-54]|uniref:D-glycerate dehydrogenase n=1 Tax=Aquibacillus salsiterrae TaxID=2950439 RepID=A0A9X4AHB5_9BACI|nr:D-glycerate dehydrogenase [Aquibacillus salsiterrae]MDC3418013.1 D-glycerate dehydrogenase [Aquibacillus salsiterrae]